jgi:hypothetical protein
VASLARTWADWGIEQPQTATLLREDRVSGYQPHQFIPKSNSRPWQWAPKTFTTRALPPRKSSSEESPGIREPGTTPSASLRAAGLSWSLGAARRREQHHACIGPPPWAGTGSSREPRRNWLRHASEAVRPHAQPPEIEDARNAGHR